MRLALVITTYERPDALAAVLDSVARQRVAPDEIVIADDGSGAATQRVIAGIRRALRRAGARRLAAARRIPRSRACAISRIAATSTDYLVFIDGDMLLHPEFIADHAAPGAPRASTRRACACTPMRR